MPAAAEVIHYPVDPVHSQVGFTVRHLVATVPGQFNEFSGDVWADPADVAGTLKVKGTVKAASIDTNNEKRDGHLSSPDFFDVEKHPELTFVSKAVKKKGEGYVVTGDLTMRGVTKTVDFDAVVHGFATHPATNTPMTALEMTTTVNRLDYGIKWNKTFDKGAVLVSNEVTITIRLEAVVPPKEG
jgi:polyisoprenoid-binding protein YceI